MMTFLAKVTGQAFQFAIKNVSQMECLKDKIKKVPAL